MAAAAVLTVAVRPDRKRPGDRPRALEVSDPPDMLHVHQDPQGPPAARGRLRSQPVGRGARRGESRREGLRPECPALPPQREGGDEGDGDRPPRRGGQARPHGRHPAGSRTHLAVRLGGWGSR